MTWMIVNSVIPIIQSVTLILYLCTFYIRCHNQWIATHSVAFSAFFLCGSLLHIFGAENCQLALINNANTSQKSLIRQKFISQSQVYSLTSLFFLAIYLLELFSLLFGSILFEHCGFRSKIYRLLFWILLTYHSPHNSRTQSC